MFAFFIKSGSTHLPKIGFNGIIGATFLAGVLSRKNKGKNRVSSSGKTRGYFVWTSFKKRLYPNIRLIFDGKIL